METVEGRKKYLCSLWVVFDFARKKGANVQIGEWKSICKSKLWHRKYITWFLCSSRGNLCTQSAVADIVHFYSLQPKLYCNRVVVPWLCLLSEPSHYWSCHPMTTYVIRNFLPFALLWFASHCAGKYTGYTLDDIGAQTLGLICLSLGSTTSPSAFLRLISRVCSLHRLPFLFGLPLKFLQAPMRRSRRGSVGNQMLHSLWRGHPLDSFLYWRHTWPRRPVSVRSCLGRIASIESLLWTATLWSCHLDVSERLFCLKKILFFLLICSVAKNWKPPQQFIASCGHHQHNLKT